MPDQRLIYLFDCFLQDKCSPEELKELSFWVLNPKQEQLLRELLEQNWEKFSGNAEMPAAKANEILKDILGQTSKPQARLIKFTWKKIAVAACLLIGLAFAAYLVFFKKESRSSLAETQVQRFKNDIDPGKYKARLTLADGSSIILDSVTLGKIAEQGSTIVSNKNGSLVYNSDTASSNQQLLYNILTTAKGETYATVLSDGSKVWLNSGSTLKFPVAFRGKERRVEITGEAYFEIKHNASMPFIVNVNDMEVHDIGTEFNINAYPDESDVKTTLVSGSAKVVRGNRGQLLAPGQQVQLNSQGELSLNRNVDVDQVVAWKSGKFLFKSTDIKTLMRQLNRWYDIDVKFETTPVTGFNAKISRETPLSSILKALELTGEVKFRIEGKKVVVMK